MKKRMLCLLLFLMLLLSACTGPEVPVGSTTLRTPGTSTAPTGETETWYMEPTSDIMFTPFGRGSSNGYLFLEREEDLAIMHLMLPPLAKEVVVDTQTGEKQWVFIAATDIQDVTKENQADLTKYQVTLPRGKTAEEVESGYVYEIKLRPKMCWVDGTPITADDYLYSMEQLLDPEMECYAAEWGGYCEGESALAGAFEYYNVGELLYDRMVPLYEEGETPVYAYDLQTEIAAGHVYFDPYAMEMALCPPPYNLGGMLSSDGSILVGELFDRQALAYIPITTENYETLKAVIADAVENTLKMDWDALDQTRQEQLIMEALWINDGSGYPPVSFDTVGLYKVDDYTLRYVCKESCDYETFLYLNRENWLVHEETYEASLEEDSLVNYGEVAVSCGPYQVVFEESTREKIVLVQNEYYWGYTQNADGTLSAMTPYQVDGAYQPQYEAYKIVVVEKNRG